MNSDSLHHQSDMPSQLPEESQPVSPTQYAPPPPSYNITGTDFSSPYTFPYQQPPVMPPAPKSFFQKKVAMPLWLLILLGLISFAGLVSLSTKFTDNIAGGSGQSNSSSSGSSPNGQATQSGNTSTVIAVTTTPAEISTPGQPSKIGGTITVNGVSCTLISVKIIAGDEFTQPESGNEFLVVSIKLVNNSDTDANYNEFDFHVRTGAGNVTDPEVPPNTYTANNVLNTGTLSPAGQVAGDVIIEAPKGDHKAELSWEPDYNSSSTDNLWYLGL